MSVRHPELCELVDRLVGGAQLRVADRDLLEQYAESEPYVVEDQLDRVTVENLEHLTGREDVWTPRRAARALLATQPA